MPSLTGAHPTSIRSRRAATMRGVNCWRASADPSVIDSYVHIYLLRGRVGAWQKHSTDLITPAREPNKL